MLMISGFSSIVFHTTTFTATFASATAKVLQMAKDFFTHLLLHPGEHSQAILIMGAVIIAAVVGPVYLAKRAYDKRNPH